MKSSTQSADSLEEDLPAPRLPHDAGASLPERSSLELHRFYLSGERPEREATATTAAPLAAWAFPREAPSEEAASMPASGVDAAALRYASMVASDRAAAVSELLNAIGEALTQLRGVVVSDAQHAPAAHGAKALERALGGPSGGQIDIAALASRLPDDRGPKPLDASRLSELRGVTEILEGAKRSLESARVHLLMGKGPQQDAAGAGIRVERCDDPYAAALSRVDTLTRSHLELARALRRARLEKSHAYRPELHDAWLAALEVGALSETERRALPAVVLVANLLDVEPHLPQLLAEDRPLHAILSEPPVGDGGSGSPFGGRLAGLARAFDRSYVTSIDARSEEGIDEALAAMSRQNGPALAVLPEVPLDIDPALYRWLAHASGAHLAFTYDPGAEPATERWRLPADGVMAPRGRAVSVPCVGPTEDATALDFTLSAADLACLEASSTPHRLALRPEEWAADQAPLDVVLEGWEQRAQRAELPFVWSVDAEGGVVRVLVTRALAERARERRRAALALAELSGLDERAGEAAASPADETEARHATEMQRVRERAAYDATVRVINVLVDLSPEEAKSILGRAAASTWTAPTAPSATTAGAAPLPDAPDGQAAPAPTQAAEPAAEARTEPFVDSPRCTTCNECVNSFPDVFAYNADKQAVLVGKRPPPFASLVKAAERCADECIYPGAPRPDDPTATPALIERAKKLA